VVGHGDEPLRTGAGDKPQGVGRFAVELTGERNIESQERSATTRSRFVCYAKGLLGWMRLGYSPGWAGRSPKGLGPCTSYLMTGEWLMPMGYPMWTGASQGSW